MKVDDIFGVIVLYNCKVEDSSTIKTLNKSLKNEKLSLLIYDNSPKKQYDKSEFMVLNFKCYYIHNSLNPGICEAYNMGLHYMKKQNKKWLLLLDQDTHFSNSFFRNIKEFKEDNVARLGALIPKVISFGTEKIISPMKLSYGGKVKEIKYLKNSIVLEKKTTGINSGTLLSKSFLDVLVQFNKEFPLDMLDHWYFREIHRHNFLVFLLNDTIYQELSVTNIEKEMSVNRYEKLIKSEKLFLKKDYLDYLFFKIRLFSRLIKQFCYKEKTYFLITMKHLFK